MSKVFSRRNLLIGAGAVVAAGGATYFLTSKPGLDTGGKLENPEVLASKDGLLEVELTAAPVELSIAGKTAKMISYNGTVPGPTFKVKPGDALRVKLTNNLDKATNLHTHGLFVSPEGNSDNPFVHVMPGESFDYEFKIPADHSEGTHWFHPHMHGEVANQVFGGLYGTIIVESDETPEVTEDRVLVISDSQFNEDGSLAEPNMMGLMMGREGDIVMVNGMVQPTGSTKKKATERWRIVNACVSRYLNLKVVGGTSHVLGFDGHKFDESMQMNQVVLAPGNRADLIVQVTDDKVSLNYTTVAHQDMMGMGSMKNGNNTQFDNYPLFTLKAEGAEAIQLAVPKFEKNLDLTQVPVQAQRQFVLEMPGHDQMMSGKTGGFTINGEEFNMDKINTMVADGTVEEWTIVNKTTMQHPFHLHIWPMQVVDVAGTALDFVLYQDVVTVPNGSSVKVRVAFNSHQGKTLYHCHILDHEDQGMMGVIESK